MERSNSNNRRNFLKSAAATLVAASVPVAAAAQKGDDEASGNQQDPIYIHGCAWNRDLPGVFGQACFTFEVRAKVGGDRRGNYPRRCVPRGQFSDPDKFRDEKRQTLHIPRRNCCVPKR